MDFMNIIFKGHILVYRFVIKHILGKGSPDLDEKFIDSM